MNKVKEWLEKIHDLFAFPSHNRTFAILGILLLAIIIPVTVTFLAQKTQTQQSAHIACDADDYWQCGSAGSCPSNQKYGTDQWVHVYVSTYCAYSCYSSGRVAGKCGVPPACSTHTYTGECNGTSLCDLRTHTPSSCGASEWINCHPNSTECGYVPKTCTQVGGTCAYGGCVAGNHNPSGTCGSSYQQCCNVPAPTAKPTVDPNACSTRGGSCEKYQCNNGETNIGGSCSFADSVCCIKKTPTYSCLNPGDPTATAFSGSDGSVTYCSSPKICNNASPNPYPDANGPSDAAKHLCVAFDPNSCTCESSGNPSDTKFTCTSGGTITRSCGTGLVCNNNYKGAQSGLWPCVTNQYNGCKNFSASGLSEFSDPACVAAAKTKASSCVWPQFYHIVSESDTNWQCEFMPDTNYCEAQNHPFTNASGQKKTTSDATCQKYQCGNDQNSIGGSCSFPDSVCCISSSEFGATTSYKCINSNALQGTDGSVTYCPSGHTCNSSLNGFSTKDGSAVAKFKMCGIACGAEGQACCPSGNKCTSSGLSCNSSSVCVKTGGGGGGGGGSNPTATPIPCQNGKTTQIALNLKLDGIGTGSFENNTPAHTSRTGIYVKVTDQNSAAITVPNSTNIQFSYTNGTFNSPTIDLGTALSCGHTYSVTVKIPRYLPVKGTVTYGKSNVIALSPITGDVNKVRLTDKVIVGDDLVSILDYNILRDCHTDPTVPKTFTDNTNTVTLSCADLMNFIDYSDGGVTGDEWSYNYNAWVRGYFKANGY